MNKEVFVLSFVVNFSLFWGAAFAVSSGMISLVMAVLLVVAVSSIIGYAVVKREQRKFEMELLEVNRLMSLSEGLRMKILLGLPLTSDELSTLTKARDK